MIGAQELVALLTGYTLIKCPAIPSGADADAAQLMVSTNSRNTILPEGPLPWFEDIEGEEESLARKSWLERISVKSCTPTGHRIHSLELIGCSQSGP